MNVHLIDSTLREGFQASAESIFRNDEGPLRYLGMVAGTAAGLVDRFETYMPGPCISDKTWAQLVDNHRDNLQVYVGVTHNFDISERPELEDGPWKMLSTTLVRHEQDDIARDIGRIKRHMGNTALRVGVECAASMTVPEVVKLVRRVADNDNVKIVSLNDSNGVMNNEWLRQFFGVYDASKVPNIDLGFHVHNGKALAARKKIKTALELAEQSGINTIEIDATAYGLGDHRGILSTLEAAKLIGYNLRSDLREALAKAGVEMFARTARPKASIDIARSHYDDYGRLRREYME